MQLTINEIRNGGDQYAQVADIYSENCGSELRREN